MIDIRVEVYYYLINIGPTYPLLNFFENKFSNRIVIYHFVTIYNIQDFELLVGLVMKSNIDTQIVFFLSILAIVQHSPAALRNVFGTIDRLAK